MGRLFWKFFLFIWLLQMAAIVGVGTYFWFERHQGEAPGVTAPSFDERPDGAARLPPRPPHPHMRPPRSPRLPVAPILGGLIVSLVGACLLYTSPSPRD